MATQGTNHPVHEHIPRLVEEARSRGGVLSVSETLRKVDSLGSIPPLSERELTDLLIHMAASAQVALRLDHQDGA